MNVLEISTLSSKSNNNATKFEEVNHYVGIATRSDNKKGPG